MPDCEHCCDTHITRAAPVAAYGAERRTYRLDERRVQLCPACVTGGERVWITVGAEANTGKMSAALLLALA